MKKYIVILMISLMTAISVFATINKNASANTDIVGEQSVLMMVSNNTIKVYDESLQVEEEDVVFEGINAKHV